MHWNIKEIDAPELAKWQTEERDPFRVIDVREMQEIAAGTITDAEAMPMATIPLRVSDLNRDEKLVFICRSGARSAQVCMFLQQQGYDNVYNLRGGMIGWVRSNQPVGLPKAS